MLWLGCSVPGQEVPEQGPDPLQNRPIDVLVVAPRQENVVRRVVLPGGLRAFESTTLHSRIPGYVDSVAVDIGDRVERDQVVAIIDVPELHDELEGAQAELEALRAQVDVARAELERSRADRRLRELTFERMRQVREEDPDVMSQHSVDEARAAFEVASADTEIAQVRIREGEGRVRQALAGVARLRTQLSFAQVRAPFGGIVTERSVDPGALVEPPGSPDDSAGIVKISSVDRLRLSVDVPEAEVPWLQVGDAATASVDSLPGTVFEGQVSRLSGALDPATRTMRAEIDLNNTSGLLHPGMYARANLVLDEIREALTVPAEAVRVDGNGEHVFTVSGGRAVRVGVTSSLGDGIRAVVTDGLAGTETLVMSSRSALTDGARVRLESPADGGQP